MGFMCSSAVCSHVSVKYTNIERKHAYRYTLHTFSCRYKYRLRKNGLPVRYSYYKFVLLEKL